MKNKSKISVFLLFLAVLGVMNCLIPSTALAQDLVITGGDIHIDEGEQVNNTIVIFGSTRVDGEVWQGVVNILGNTEINGNAGSVVAVGPAVINGTAGDVVVVGGPAVIRGQVTGDLVAVGGPVELASSAKIMGDLVIVGGALVRDPGAVVTGSEMSLTLKEALREQIIQWLKGFPFPTPSSPVFWWRLVSLFLTAVVLILVSILFPKVTAKTAHQLAVSPILSLFWGILIIFLALPTTILLFITLLGIPLAAMLWLVLACAYYLGFASLSILLGEKVLTALGREEPELYISTLLGAVFIGIITWIPYVGMPVGWLLKITGLGAAVLSLVNRQRS